MSKLNINDIKVGEKYVSSVGRNIEVLCIGGKNIFYSYDDGGERIVSINGFAASFTKKPKENEDIYYRWFMDCSGWNLSSYYYSKNGKRTDGSIYTHWGDLQKKIATEFKPIDKNGDYVEVEE